MPMIGLSWGASAILFIVHPLDCPLPSGTRRMDRSPPAHQTVTIPSSIRNRARNPTCKILRCFSLGSRDKNVARRCYASLPTAQPVPRSFVSPPTPSGPRTRRDLATHVAAFLDTGTRPTSPDQPLLPWQHGGGPLQLSVRR